MSPFVISEIADAPRLVMTLTRCTLAAVTICSHCRRQIDRRGGRQLADSSSTRLSLTQDELFAAGNCASRAGDRLRIDRQCWQMMKTSVRVGSLDGQSQQTGEKYGQ